MSRKQDLDWSFGLRNKAGKYLTAEAFGYKIVCAAKVMKKKQTWFLETNDDPAKDTVYIRSHLGKYLTVDGNGKFTGDGDAAGDEQEFVIEAQADGRWALKSMLFGWYAGGTGERLTAFTKDIAEDRLWVVRLAMHPMVTIRNVKRQAFMHLDDVKGDSITTNEIIPWGHDAVLSLHFFDNGTYGIQTSTGSFLSVSGSLSAEADDNCQFVLDFHGGVVSFKSKTSGNYVTSLGKEGLCKATKKTVTDDERYELQNSYPQVTLQSSNGKLLSIKQGIEVAASQSLAEGVTDREIWQLEPLGGDKWTVKGSTDKLWVAKQPEKKGEKMGLHCEADPIPGSIDEVDPQDIFTLEFYGNSIAFKAVNGKYVAQEMNGYIKPTATEASAGANSLFEFTLVNRPTIALRGEHGFINTLPSGLLECNKAEAELYKMHTSGGMVALQHIGTGKFWKVGANGISANGDVGEFYELELFQNSKLTLKYKGAYFKGQQNGAYTATGTEPDKSALFEY